MALCGIYKIQSKEFSDRCYIGSAVNINKRKLQHFNELIKNGHANGKLQNHVNKYGIEDLNFEIILYNCEKEDLLFLEQLFINSYDPYFNLYKIAGSPLGSKRSEETKKKLRESHIGINIWMSGRKASKETKLKMSIKQSRPRPWRKGKPLKEEHKQNLINAHRTEEFRNKQREHSIKIWELKRLQTLILN